MDYEKEYKDAVARMELCVRTGLKITPEYIFPELAESEDEKIRKEMIRYFTEMKKGGSAALPYDDCIAYLEKQKENTWSEEDDAKVEAMCKEGNLKPSERAWLKNLKNRVWKDPQHAIRVTKGFGDPDGPQFELVDLPEEQKPIPANSVGLKEQKLAWSVKDEKNLKSVVSTLWFALNTPHFPLNYARIIELEGWLKSLRPQPKVEWTGDDEQHLKWLCRIIHSRKNHGELSLAEESELGHWIDKWINHNPQPHWKPSEEQPSLPDNLDEAASKYYFSPACSWDDNEERFINAFKAGAKWMAEQGITITGDTDDEYVRILEDVEKAICKIAPDSTVNVQIRK